MVSKRGAARVDPSQITQFLCYTCGDAFHSVVEYHRHIMEHQAVSLIYQLYYLEHEVILRISAKEKSFQYHNNNPESTEAPKDSSSPQAMTGRRHTDPIRRVSGEPGSRNIRYSEDYEGKEDLRRKNSRQRVFQAQETVRTAEKLYYTVCLLVELLI